LDRILTLPKSKAYYPDHQQRIGQFRPHPEIEDSGGHLGGGPARAKQGGSDKRERLAGTHPSRRRLFPARPGARTDVVRISPDPNRFPEQRIPKFRTATRPIRRSWPHDPRRPTLREIRGAYNRSRLLLRTAARVCITGVLDGRRRLRRASDLGSRAAPSTFQEIVESGSGNCAPRAFFRTATRPTRRIIGIARPENALPSRASAPSQRA